MMMIIIIINIHDNNSNYNKNCKSKRIHPISTINECKKTLQSKLNDGIPLRPSIAK